MPRIEVLVGMIGSGKSTYARGRADDGAIVVSHDAITQGLHGGAYRFEQGLREMYRRVEAAIAYSAFVEGRDIVVDRTHLTRESRARWVKLARDLGAGVVAVRFPLLSAQEHALRRYRSDPRGRSLRDWVSIAAHHYDQAVAEPLSAGEGFDALIIHGELPACATPAPR